MSRDITEKQVRESIFCAVDTPDLNAAISLSNELAGVIGGIKIGKEFFTSHGPEGVRKLSDQGLPIFLDLKFHDIPNTVAGAIRAATRLNVFMVNVHVSGGGDMMKAAVGAANEEAQKLGIEPPLVIGVTALTSLSDQDLPRIGVRSPSIREHVSSLAEFASDCGLDGVVCSGNEVSAIRGRCPEEFKLVVPGLRPPWVTDDDQKRIMEPAEAYSQGADFLIIGRPITSPKHPQHHSPKDAAEAIVQDILRKSDAQQTA